MTTLRQVITDRVMLCDAVIPNRNGIVTPTQSNLIFGSLYLLKKVLQDLVTLPLIQIQNMPSERLVNVEIFKARDRVRFYQLMQRGPYLTQGLVDRRNRATSVVVIAECAHVMNSK